MSCGFIIIYFTVPLVWSTSSLSDFAIVNNTITYLSPTYLWYFNWVFLKTPNECLFNTKLEELITGKSYKF